MNKKIIILSENSDLSTNDIMNCCKVKEYDVRRINCDDRNLQIHILENDVNVTTSFDSFSIETDSVCWFRRADFPSVYINSEKNSLAQEKKTFGFVEKRETFNALKYWIINNCKHSSAFFSDNFNKIDVLIKAKATGINVADWVVTDNKDAAISFAKQYESVACKPFSSFMFFEENSTYKYFTEKVSCSDLQLYPQIFVPRIFQQYIEKKYELRSFYFHGAFFTYAILSQNNPKTSVDFRNYDMDKPNRCIPFDLPVEYSTKLTSLMKKLKLDTGSCDILVDKNDDYYFLEVNPVGQFGFGSYECNSNIEEFIANYLIKMTK